MFWRRCDWSALKYIVCANFGDDLSLLASAFPCPTDMEVSFKDTPRKKDEIADPNGFERHIDREESLKAIRPQQRLSTPQKRGYTVSFLLLITLLAPIIYLKFLPVSDALLNVVDVLPLNWRPLPEKQAKWILRKHPLIGKGAKIYLR